jgi:hypothetical protein
MNTKKIQNKFLRKKIEMFISVYQQHSIKITTKDKPLKAAHTMNVPEK